MRNSERALWESRIEDLKKEHNRTVDALTAWIEQLQAQVGAQFQAQQQPQLEAAMVPMTMYENEEEAALRDALDMGLISKDDFEQELSRLNNANVEMG